MIYIPYLWLEVNTAVDVEEKRIWDISIQIHYYIYTIFKINVKLRTNGSRNAEMYRHVFV